MLTRSIILKVCHDAILYMSAVNNTLKYFLNIILGSKPADYAHGILQLNFLPIDAGLLRWVLQSELAVIRK